MTEVKAAGKSVELIQKPIELTQKKGEESTHSSLESRRATVARRLPKGRSNNSL